MRGRHPKQVNTDPIPSWSTHEALRLLVNQLQHEPGSVVQSTNRSEVSLTHQANGGQDPVWSSAESDLGQNPLTGEHFGG